MTGSGDGRALLETLIQRDAVLHRLQEGVAHKRDLVEDLDQSRSTLDRAVRELVDSGLAERRDEGYAATAAGRLALEQLGDVRDGLEDIVAAQAVLEPLPGEAVPPTDAVVGSRVLSASEPAPYRPLERLHERISGATGYRAVLPALDDPRHVRLLYEHVVTAGNEADLTVSPDLFDTLREEFPRRLAAMAGTAGFDLAVASAVPPYGLLILEGPGADESTVALEVFSPGGGVHGVLLSGTQGAAAWAGDRLASARQGATDRTAEAAADADDAGAGPGGRALPVELEREGFVRLDVAYFRDEPVAAPTTAWRAGLSLPEVHTGYAVERLAPEAGEAQSGADGPSTRRGSTAMSAAWGNASATLRSTLVDALAAGENRLLLGPPGSGKSTVCKRVACAWYDEGRGPVCYRPQGRGRAFSSVEVLLDHLDGADGHALVVVEDAVRPEADAAFEVLPRTRDRDDVSVLLDAREGEWADPPGDVPPEVRVPTTSMPGLQDRDVERIVSHFEGTVGEAVEVPLERLHAEVQTEVAGDEVGSAGIALLLHRLATYADPLTDEQTSLEAAAADCYGDLAGDEVALSVAVLANALNVAGRPVRRDALYAVADPSELDAVDDAIERLAGTVVFPREDGGLRTVHESWSGAFLAAVLEAEGADAAASRYGEAVSELLALADDADRRAAIAAHLAEGRDGGDAPAERAAIAATPREWVADTLRSLYAMGRERPALAPLFGDPDTIALPAATPEDLHQWRLVWHGRALLEAGLYDRARETFQRLPDTGGELARERALGLAALAREQGSFDEAETEARRCLDVVDDDSPADRGRASLERGRVAQERGDHEAAGEHFDRALRDFEAVGDRRRRARTLRGMGTSARRQGEYERAEQVHELALQEFQALGDRRGAARTLNSLGILARRQGRQAESRDYFERSIAISRELGDRQAESDTRNNLGIAAATRGEYAAAREHLERSLELTRDLGDRDSEAATVDNLGLVLERLGEFDRAVDLMEQGIALEREVGDRQGVATARCNLGMVLTKQGRYDRAEECMEAALATLRDVGARREEANGLHNLGVVHAARAEYDRARDRFEESLAIKEDIGNPQGVYNSLIRLGLVALETGDLDRARERFAAAAERDDRASDPFRAAEGDLARARLACERGDLEGARELAAQVREAAEEMDANRLAGRAERLLGRIAAAADEPADSREYREAALSKFEAVGAYGDALETVRRLHDAAADGETAEEWRREARSLAAEAPGAAVDPHAGWLGHRGDRADNA